MTPDFTFYLIVAFILFCTIGALCLAGFWWDEGHG